MRRGWAAGAALLVVACGVADAAPAEREPLQVADIPDSWPSALTGDVVEMFPCDQIQAAGEWAVGQFPADVPEGWTVEVSCDLEHTYIGKLHLQDNTITLHPMMSQTPELMVWIVGHEYGHALDFGREDTSHREAWAAYRGYDPEPWCDWQVHGDDINEPCGDWAETYAACVTGWDDLWVSELADAPDALDCAVMRTLLPR